MFLTKSIGPTKKHLSPDFETIHEKNKPNTIISNIHQQNCGYSLGHDQVSAEVFTNDKSNFAVNLI